jgi:metal-responsive CopG/Arc/MetJ family transcriptional regulator
MRGNRHCYHDVMTRTTISLPDDLLKRLRLLAAERRTSMAALIREALEEKSASYRPKPRSLGIGDSGYSDTSRRAGEERAVPRSWR